MNSILESVGGCVEIGYMYLKYLWVSSGSPLHHKFFIDLRPPWGNHVETVDKIKYYAFLSADKEYKAESTPRAELSGADNVN